MRFTAHDGSVVHLSYCSNVHPAETLEGVLQQLDTFAGPARVALGVERLGLGLWLSHGVARELEADPGALAHLQARLDRHGLEVVTLNAFPYGGFHDPVVKHAVYRPDWTTPERADHTVRLATLLAALLPGDVDQGSLSTLPLGHRPTWDADRDARAREQLDAVADRLAALRRRTGKDVRLALEPEPACALETTAEVAAWLRALGREEVQACVDTAHLAVQWEDPAALAHLVDVGVAKAQVSVGLHVPDPRAERALLAGHDEPRFLHQVRGAGGAGCDDLPEALAGGVPDGEPWRVHVHLPLHAPADRTTQGVLDVALQVLVGGPVPLTRSLEVETYTWTVLPDGLRPTDDAGLVRGLAAELAWARERLLALGLKEISA